MLGWRGINGGIEGYNLYSWMCVYVLYTAQMSADLRIYGIEFRVMGYGENYKAAISIPSDQANVNMATLKVTIVNILLKSMTQRHIKVSVWGVELSQRIIKSQTCCESENDCIPNLDT